MYDIHVIFVSIMLMMGSAPYDIVACQRGGVSIKPPDLNPTTLLMGCEWLYDVLQKQKKRDLAKIDTASSHWPNFHISLFASQCQAD